MSENAPSPNVSPRDLRESIRAFSARNHIHGLYSSEEAKPLRSRSADTGESEVVVYETDGESIRRISLGYQVLKVSNSKTTAAHLAVESYVFNTNEIVEAEYSFTTKDGAPTQSVKMTSVDSPKEHTEGVLEAMDDDDFARYETELRHVETILARMQESPHE